MKTLGRLRMPDEVVELAVKVAAIRALSKDQRALVDWLERPEGLASDQEAIAFIRKLAVASNQTEPTGAALQQQVLSYSPRDWKVGIVNDALAEAEAEKRRVQSVITAFNGAKPRDLTLLAREPEDEHFHRLHQTWGAFMANRTPEATFLNEYRTYLEVRRGQAIAAYQLAFSAYAFSTRRRATPTRWRRGCAPCSASPSARP